MNIDGDKRLCNLIAKCLAYGRKVGIVSDDDNIACLDLLMRKEISWSKGDEMMLKLIISELEQEGKNVNVPKLYHGEIRWLKSLRPKPHWKPSEEQMKVLAIAKDYFEHNKIYRGNEIANGLDSILQDLKKLKED